VNAELLALLRCNTPFLDVRAPVECARGTVPGAVNLPLLTDAERARIGITYKQQNHEAAVKVGHRLVSGEVRAARVARWVEFVQCHPDAWMFCWRGGERSAIVQQWLAEAGLTVPRVAGGFKALRQTCLALLAEAPDDSKPWVILSGRTGSGKTELLRTLPNAIDLEGLARHRGSAFGARDEVQPPPVTFENLLAVAWLQHRQRTLVLEDESRTIGRLALPETWHQRMQGAPVVVLETPFEARCAKIVREYVDEPLAAGNDARILHARYTDALSRIERRLGGLRRAQIQVALDEGFATNRHAPWVGLLLEWYYDPMYDHQLANKRARVQMQGPADAVRAFLLADDSPRDSAPH